MQKRETLEEFKVLELLNDKNKEENKEVNKEMNKEATKEEMLKLRIVYARKTQKRNQARKLAIETE